MLSVKLYLFEGAILQNDKGYLIKLKSSIVMNSFEWTPKPFKRLVECFERIFLGVQTDNEWTTNS